MWQVLVTEGFCGVLVWVPAFEGDGAFSGLGAKEVEEFDSVGVFGEVAVAQEFACGGQDFHEVVLSVREGVGDVGFGVLEKGEGFFQGGFQVRGFYGGGFERDVAEEATAFEVGVEVFGAEADVVQVVQAWVVVDETLLDEAVPGFAAEVGFFAVFNFGEVWGEAGFYGAFAEELAAEGVDGANEALVDTVQGVADVGGFFSGGGGCLFSETEEKAAAHFSGGFPGEGDGGHSVHVYASGGDDADHAFDEGVGFTGTCTGQDGEVAVQVLGDGGSGGLVL